MTTKLSFSLFLLLVLAACSATPAKLDNSFQTVTPTPALLATSTVELSTSTPAPLSTPTWMVFPLPSAAPAKAFQAPGIENMVTHQVNQGTWTTYRLEDWDKKLQQKKEFPGISSIAVTSNGGLWFATTGGAVSIGVGVFYFDGKTWTHYTKANGLAADEISASAVAPDGAIWFGSICCGVSRFDGKSWRTYTTGNGLANNDIRSILVAPDGAVWFGSADAGVSRYDGKGWQSYLPGNDVGPMLALPDNSLLLTSGGASAKLTHFDGQRWTNYPTPWTDAGKYTSAMSIAPNGDLWFGTEASGVYRLSGTTWTNYSTKDGLASDEIHSVAVAKDGAAWVCTTNGLSEFDGQKWTTFTLEDDGGNHWIGPVLAAPDGSIWLGYYAGIARYISNGSH